ncbi:MAG: bifunctional DNA primase/polymerase, partial [Lysobacter sp.]|nr:bifunctional DNA primase/polymerase [Lysobacter sp.]
MSTPKRTNAPNENARHGQGGGRKVLGKTNGKGNLTTLGDAALRYARAGYRVVPLKALDKAPWLEKWPKRATTDCEQVKAWWAEQPESNVGLMPPEGCIVVDVDPRHGGSADGLDLPASTPTQETGGGGEHYVVRVEEGAELPERPGVDYLRPGKHQFVAEPSVHPSGELYLWRPGLAPWDVQPALWQPPGNASAASQASAGGSQALAPLPLRRQTAPHLACDHLRALGREVHHLAPDRWGEGEHDKWMREWVMPVHYETGGSEDGRALAHEVSALFTGYDRQALDMKWRTLGREPGRDKVTGASLEHVLRHLRRDVQAASGGIPIVGVGEFARAARPVRWLVRDWLPTGALAVLLGESNAGKSAVAVALGMSVAAGVERFCGKEVRAQGAVVYVAAEGQGGMMARVRIFGEKVLGLDAEALDRVPMFVVPVAISLSESGAVENVASITLAKVRAWAAVQGMAPPPVVLVVIDTLARNIGGDAHESDNADMSAVMNNCATLLRLLAELHPDRQQPAMLLNAHPGHGEKSRLRGAYAMQAALDVIMRIEVAAPQPTNADDDERQAIAELVGGPIAVAQPRVLQVTKARDSAFPPPLRLSFMQDSPGWLRDPETGTANTTVYLAANGEFDAVDGAPVRANRKVTDDQVLEAMAAHPEASQRKL